MPSRGSRSSAATDENVEMVRRLQTLRLTLTPLDEDDFDELAALNADPRTRSHASTRLPATPEESRAELLESDRAWRQRGHGTWTIRNARGAFVGVIETVPGGFDD